MNNRSPFSLRITRVSLLYLLVALSFGWVACKTGKSASKTIFPLNGAWIPVKEEIAGKAIPSAAFATQELIIQDSTYTFTAESVDKGVLKYDGNKMDIYGRDGVNAGKHFTTIYMMHQDSLTICYNLKGDSYPPSFETKGQPLFFLCVFKKK